MEPNPLREIRTIRQQISAECGHDAEKVFDYYQTRQDQLKDTGQYKFVTKPLNVVPTEAGADQNGQNERP